MRQKTWADCLWGREAKLTYLLVAATILLFTLLGGREIWTQEHRWADIVAGMFYRHDFLHPFLGTTDYYDKPLLSYWLIAGFSFITGKLSLWTMRLPSALSGLLALWSIYRIGTYVKDKRLGLLAGWLLLTTFYFMFWARTSSADMLNLAGTLFAVSWYLDKKSEPSFFNYSVFFLILAMTALCKGLVGVVVPMLAILPDLLMNKEWKKHLRVSFFLSMVPALLVYTAPFWLSSYFSNGNYHQNGLYLVYRENILRYFQPFDHKGPIYTYFIFLPVYLLPWAFFFLPALFYLKPRWKNMSVRSKWIVWVTFILFIFFTLSGSRRNYYVLPIVPFAILLTADWILEGADTVAKRYLWAGRIAIIFLVALFLNFDVLQPIYYSQGSLTNFASDVRTKADKILPWQQWNFVMLDAESKLRFYLQLPPEVKNYTVVGARASQTENSLLQRWPTLTAASPHVIFISRKMYEPMLRHILKNYQVVDMTLGFPQNLSKQKNKNAPVAFIPEK